MPRLRRLTLAEQVAIAFMVGVVYLALIGMVAYSSVNQFAETTTRAERTHVVLRTLDETLAIVTDAETGARGFIITGDTAHLQPYLTARSLADRHVRALDAMLGDQARQRERLARLAPLLATRLALLDESVRRRRVGGPEDALAATRSGRGRSVMDSIRAVIDTMAADESGRLGERSARARESLSRTTFLIALSFFAAVVLGLLAALFVSRDIARRLDAEAEARRAKEAAEASSRAKSEFLAMMSHELRTPLNSVIGFSNVLLKNRSGRLTDRELLYVQRIRAGGRHLLSLINEVLDLSKVEAGRMKLDRAPVMLDSLIEDTIASFEGQLRDRPLTLDAEMPLHLTPIMTDPAKLLQVLTNLIGNAIKFTERGTVRVRVIADAASRRPEVIEVVDTGIGIPLNRQASIFEAFEQGDSSTARRFGGTGLGLAVSKSLCDLMRYDLEVESEPGHGSVFRIVLTSASRNVNDSSFKLHDSVTVSGIT
jgi:signal transduction histidine kinase